MNDIAIDTIMQISERSPYISQRGSCPVNRTSRRPIPSGLSMNCFERVMDHPLTSADDIINEFALKMELFARETMTKKQN